MGVSGEVIAKLLGGPVQATTPPASSTGDELIPKQPVQQSQPSEQPQSPTTASDDDLFSNLSSGTTDVVSDLLSGDSGDATAASQAQQGGTGGTAPIVDAESTPQVTPIPSEPKPLSPPPVSTPSSVSVPEEAPASTVSASAPPSSTAFTSDDLAEIKEMLRELKKELRDQRALLSALQKILQEILDTDRTIVVGLYEKTKK